MTNITAGSTISFTTTAEVTYSDADYLDLVLPSGESVTVAADDLGEVTVTKEPLPTKRHSVVTVGNTTYVLLSSKKDRWFQARKGVQISAANLAALDYKVVTAR